MFDSAKTWLEPESGTNNYRFDEVHILGSAQLAVMAGGSLKSAVSFHARRLYGDKSGYLHVGYNQSFSVDITDPDIPFGLRVYEYGSIALPKRAFLQSVSFVSSGKVGYSFLYRNKVNARALIGQSIYCAGNLIGISCFF